MRDSAMTAAGLALGLGTSGCQTGESVKSPAPPEVPAEVEKTRSYNPNMEYRRLGTTGLWVSAVSLGGHWKKLPFEFRTEGFKKNRREVVSACIEHGINYVDACTDGEVEAYADALRGRREAGSTMLTSGGSHATGNPAPIIPSSTSMPFARRWRRRKKQARSALPASPRTSTTGSFG
jgi:hypothetical protein